MTVTTFTGWVAGGKPAKPAQPIADMVAMFHRHGYAGTGYYPDDRHLRANPPEDHCPYSHTPWPGSQPYPYILALDFMPLVEGDGKSLAPIARQIIADKRAGKAPWIKYLNWTDEQGHVWHTKWQPNEVTEASSDSGHIHISIRTDYVTSSAAAGWDPITPTSTGGTTVATAATEDIFNRVTTNRRYADTVGTLNAFMPNTDAALAGLNAKLDALTAAVHALAAGGTSVDTASVLARINEVAAEESAKVTELHDLVAELQHKLAAAAAAAAGALGQ